MKKSYIHPVSVNQAPPAYPKPHYDTAEKLERVLQENNISITLGKTLKGGTVSQIYEAEYKGAPVVVKHTENLIPYDPTELALDKEGHNTDTHILRLLSKEKDVRVPAVIAHLPEITTTILDDVRACGFTLMQDIILKRSLTVSSANTIGTMLARLAQTSRDWEQFPTNESANGSIYERGLELRLAYPNSQKEYLELEKEFTIEKYWIWPDGHPKNMFINESGEPMLIDFGRSHWGDQRYMLPNFLAHIVLYSLTGYIPRNITTQYIQDCTNAYRRLEPIDENIFCRYLAMEVLHRSYGKWIAGVNTTTQKTRLIAFGLNLFDKRVTTIHALSSMI